MRRRWSHQLLERLERHAGFAFPSLPIAARMALHEGINISSCSSRHKATHASGTLLLRPTRPALAPAPAAGGVGIGAGSMSSSSTPPTFQRAHMIEPAPPLAGSMALPPQRHGSRRRPPIIRQVRSWVPPSAAGSAAEEGAEDVVSSASTSHETVPGAASSSDDAVPQTEKGLRSSGPPSQPISSNASLKTPSPAATVSSAAAAVHGDAASTPDAEDDVSEEAGASTTAAGAQRAHLKAALADAIGVDLGTLLAKNTSAAVRAATKRHQAATAAAAASSSSDTSMELLASTTSTGPAGGVDNSGVGGVGCGIGDGPRRSWEMQWDSEASGYRMTLSSAESFSETVLRDRHTNKTVAVPSKLITRQRFSAPVAQQTTAATGTASAASPPPPPECDWVDVQSHPTATLEEYRSAIATLLIDLDVHETLVHATMESVILPQFSVVSDCHCLVLRTAVEDTTFEMDSIQELTNRLTILVFRNSNRVVTVHRAPMPFLEEMSSLWDEEHAPGANLSYLTSLITKETVRTYHRAISQSIVLFDVYESRLFIPQRHRATLAREIYHIKRRASVYSRTLALLHEAFVSTANALRVQHHDAYLQDVQQDIVHVRSLADELSDNANTVLQLLFQLSSYQLNELMRVLTMFSAFFIPLSFIASCYGMNFDSLPFVHNEWGPFLCVALMVLVSASIMSWFRWKKFW